MLWECLGFFVFLLALSVSFFRLRMKKFWVFVVVFVVVIFVAWCHFLILFSFFRSPFLFLFSFLILIATFGPRCQQIAIYENVHDTRTLWPFINALDYILSIFGEKTKRVGRGRWIWCEKWMAKRTQRMICISWSTIWKYKESFSHPVRLEI